LTAAMATFSPWHWTLVLLVVLFLFGSQQAATIKWMPLVEGGAGLLIAWLLFAALRGL